MQCWAVLGGSEFSCSEEALFRLGAEDFLMKEEMHQFENAAIVPPIRICPGSLTIPNYPA
jgi:hypothetical protein